MSIPEQAIAAMLRAAFATEREAQRLQEISAMLTAGSAVATATASEIRLAANALAAQEKAS